MIVDSDFNKEVWGDRKFTFIAPCKCSYCGKEFKGRFVEAVHEYIECPNCKKNLSWSER